MIIRCLRWRLQNCKYCLQEFIYIGRIAPALEPLKNDLKNMELQYVKSPSKENKFWENVADSLFQEANF